MKEKGEGKLVLEYLVRNWNFPAFSRNSSSKCSFRIPSEELKQDKAFYLGESLISFRIPSEELKLWFNTICNIDISSFRIPSEELKLKPCTI